MTDRFPDIVNPAIDTNGDAIAGARLFFYRVGTSTKKNTYSDSAKTILNANPVVADSGGRFGDIFMLTDEQYKVALAPAGADDPPTSPIWTKDNVSPVRENPVADLEVISKSADYTVLTTDKGKLIEVDASSGPATITLPAAADATDGFFVYVKKIDSSTNAVTVDGDGAETIDGETTVTLSSQYDFVGVNTDGTKWLVFSKTALPAATTADVGKVVTVNSTGGYDISDAFRPNNLVINGDVRVTQLGTSFNSTTTPANNDDTYLFDQVILLSDGNDRVDVSQETSVVPDGVYSAIRCDVETVGGTSEKFGFLFPIEAKDCRHVIGGTASLSFQARTTGGAVENLRAHVLAWDGTEDTITSDVVSTWGAEGSNPTFATNWTAENTGSDLSLTNEYQTFRIEDVSIDTSGALNLAVFIHVDDTDLVATDLLYITDVALVPGALAVPPKARAFGEELAMCQRYFEKTFPLATAPAQNAGVAGSVNGTATSSGRFRFNWRFAVSKRINPSLTLYNPSAANSSCRNTVDNSDTAASADSTGNGATSIRPDAIDATDANDDMAIHIVADARL